MVNMEEEQQAAMTDEMKQEIVSEDKTKSEDKFQKEIIPKIDKPSVSKEEFVAIRRDLSSLRQKKEALFEIRSVISKEIKDLFHRLKSLKEGRDSLTLKVQELKKKRDEINTAIKEEIDKVKVMRDVTGTNSNSQAQKAPERINVGFLKSEIAKMQYHLETNPLSPEEEKKLMKVIKEKERLISKAKEVDESKGQLKETSKKIDDLKENSNKVHADVEVLAKQSQEKHESLISISKDIKYLKSQEKEIHSMFIVAKDAYKQKRILFVQNKPFFDQKRQKREFNTFKEHKEEQILKKIEKTVEDKIRSGQKITTEDLLSFRP